MTKEQERAELHRAIWQIANDLRYIRHHGSKTHPRNCDDGFLSQQKKAFLSGVGYAQFEVRYHD